MTALAGEYNDENVAEQHDTARVLECASASLLSGGVESIPLLLSKSQIEDLVDLPQAMACVERAFLEQGGGHVTPWPPYEMRSGGTIVRVRSGGLAEQGRLGLRATSAAAGVSLIFESPSGRLLAVMAYPFSDLRLHAVAALGIDRLASPGARDVAMLGSGSNALGLLKAACTVRTVEAIRVYSPNAQHRASFAAEAEQALGLPVVAVDEPERAVTGAEIVIVATNSRTPALRGAWLGPGTLVASIGARTELDEEVILRSERVVTTSRVHELEAPGSTDEWTLVHLIRSGALAVESLVELGEVVAGRIKRPDGIAVFREPQGGFTDIALAALAYQRALELGRGTDWSLD